MKIQEIKAKYWSQKTKARHRGIEFNLTFDDWWNLWKKSGKWELRGCRKGQYVMSRYNDEGPYELGNVIIQTADQNLKEIKNGGGGWNRGMPSPDKGKKHSPERIEKARLARWGKKETII